jgi:preprotein translocase subunit SecA
VVTANDYLADRDATELRPALEALGLTVGVVAHGLSPSDRRRAYQANVTFVCNKEVAFDYLRDRLLAEETDGDPVARLKARRALGLATERGDPVLRGLDVAIVDEVDSVLIDDAGTPLIISTEVDDAVDDGTAQEAVEIARGLVPGGDFVIDGLSSLARLTPAGEVAVDEAALERGGLWRQRIRRHELVAAALTAAHALEADRHYIVRDGKIVMIDQYSGRTMPDRYWGHDLHRMVEWKEGLPAGRTRRSLASISFQRFFRSYRTLAGMSGTVREVAVELARVYGLRLTRIPRRLPLQRAILPRRFFGDRDQLWHEAAATVRSLSSAGRPVLIGVRSVAEAERASAALNAANVRHALLSAAHDREEAEIVAGAGQAGTVTIATNMAGRGTDIRLGRDVAGKGGLAVMICERHDSRRVDRQLMGRCARQGDPGAVIEMLSREDELLTLSPAWMQRLLDLRPFGEETVALVARLAQRRMERMQYRRRLDLVRRDKRLAKMLAFAGGLG